jgi:uncharacterized membrane protein YfcA
MGVSLSLDFSLHVLSDFWQAHWVWVIVLMGVVSFAAGLLDSIAGGGGLLLLPAWLFFGVSPATAMVQNKFINTPGTLLAARNFLKHGQVNWEVVLVGFPFSIIGSWIGAKVLLMLDPKWVLLMVMCLVPFAIVVILWPKNKPVAETNTLSQQQKYVAIPFCCLLIGFYDGLFGPATGSLLIMLLHYGAHLSLLRSSANAKILNLASNAGALAVFAWKGQILYTLCFFPMLCAMGGNHVGSMLALRRGVGVIKKALFVSMAILFATAAARYFFF